MQLGVKMCSIIFLALRLSSGVIECGRRPTDPNTLAGFAAAEQRETAAASQRSGGQASEGPGEDPRPALGTALGATVSAWQWHSAGTGSSSPSRGGGFEQPYGAQVQERGGAAGAQAPLNCQPISMPLCVAGCKDQNGSEMVAQSSSEGMQPP